MYVFFFFFSSRRRHTRFSRDWSSDVCSSDLFGLTALPAVLSRAYLAWCLAELGAFAEGITTGEEGVQMAKTVNHPYSLLVAAGGVGMLYFRKGALHQAIAMLEGGLELCRVWNIRDWFPL